MSVKWEKLSLRLSCGEMVKASAPVIVSASRATDIPAFYADWLLNRLTAGYAAWINPFDGKKIYVSFERTRLLVFWSKNPRPLMPRLDAIEKLGFCNYYFQYTLNDYDLERFELGVPPVVERIETLKELSRRIGPKRVVWRFDPLLLSGSLALPDLIDRIRRIRDAVAGYTERLVISFIDLACYRKVRQNIVRGDEGIRELTLDEMRQAAEAVSRIAHEGGMSVGSCAEAIDLDSYGIEHNRCIDDRIMVRCFGEDKLLMQFLGIKPKTGDLFERSVELEAGRNVKDMGQRAACGCVMSKDIGRYNTCPHLCVYCYANGNQKEVMECRRRHDPTADLL